MRKILILLFITLSFSKTTFSQTKQSIPVSLTTDEWNTILKSLGKLPLEESQGLYMYIVQQVNKEISLAQPKVPAPKQKPDSTQKTKP